MTYATQQDLIDRFGAAELVQLTDRTNRPATTIDTTTVARAIADAEALADGYLAKRYALPLAAVPPQLVRIVCDIARYYLHGKAAEPDGPIARAHGQAVAWLRDLAKGLVELETGGSAPAAAGGGGVRTTAAQRVMSRDSLRGM